MTFTPPKPWTPDAFRSVVTSLEDHTIVDQVAIPWCTTHDRPDELDEYGDDGGLCEVSTGGPDHKWWRDTA